MDNAQAPAARPGIFKRDAKGTTIPPVNIRVERGRIQFFAQVLGEREPLYSDVAAAQAAGHPDIAAPPSFFMVMEALADEERRRLGIPAAIDLVGGDFRYLLHGDEHYTYDGLVYAGEEVSLTTRVVDFYEKKGGLMEFVVFESLITHVERGVLVRAERTLLHRLG